MTNEVEGLLRKGAVVLIPLGQEKTRFYSTYFLVPKKNRGHQPILNLMFFNVSVHETLFKMETLHSIIAIM